jgi:succinylglutamate desuccinylase
VTLSKEKNMTATNDYPVELQPVDITPYKAGNTGIDYVTTFDSGEPGPHVAITAVVHGNELCGAITLDYLFQNDIRPLMGKLTLAFANHEAYHSFSADDPMASRFVDEDFNRTWGLDVLEGERDTVETRRARELRPVIDQADFLLDIHSMQHKTPALMICGPLAKGQQFAKDIGTPEFIVSDAGHAAGKRMRDYGDFGDPDSPKNSLLLEAGQHWEENSALVSVDTTLRYLKLLGAIDLEFGQDDHLELPDDQKLIEVSGPITIKTDSFRFAEDYKGFEIIEDAGTILGWDGDEEVLTPYDNCVLIMPSKRLHKGQSAVRLGQIVG